MSNNLWPDFELADSLPTPKSIIEDAGKGLTEKTGSLVHFYTKGVTFSGETATMNCSLYAPRLNYMYPFMTVRFPMKQLYPVQLIVSEFDQPLVANNAAELLGALGRAFNAPPTMQTIKQLLALSK